MWPCPWFCRGHWPSSRCRVNLKHTPAAWRKAGWHGRVFYQLLASYGAIWLLKILLGLCSLAFLNLVKWSQLQYPFSDVQNELSTSCPVSPRHGSEQEVGCLPVSTSTEWEGWGATSEAPLRAKERIAFCIFTIIQSTVWVAKIQINVYIISNINIKHICKNMAEGDLSMCSSVENYSNKPSNHRYLFGTQGRWVCTMLRTLYAVPSTVPAALLSCRCYHYTVPLE